MLYHGSAKCEYLPGLINIEGLLYPWMGASFPREFGAVTCKSHRYTLLQVMTVCARENRERERGGERPGVQ
jgi:hypothetical protein